jgi:hypothetical protein
MCSDGTLDTSDDTLIYGARNIRKCIRGIFHYACTYVCFLLEARIYRLYCSQRREVAAIKAKRGDMTAYTEPEEDTILRSVGLVVGAFLLQAGI